MIHPFSRTRTALCTAVVGLSAIGALAQDSEPTVPTSAANEALENEITPEMNAAVTKGLAALAQLQRDDGSFGGQRYGSNAAITGLAGLAFMADGHMPGRGQYSEQVERALEFILDNTNETGLIAGDTSHGPMYGHGFATLFLGEVYGMTAGGDNTQQARRTHDTLVRAVRLIVQTQNEEGGWRYNPVPHDADISVTITQIMALRSARNAGIEVPIETINRAVEYVRRCQNPDGGFRYQAGRGASAWPRSAAGVASLYYAGIYEGEDIERGLDYLVENSMPGRSSNAGAHYFYGHYYAVQTMYLAGGDRWATWWPAIRDELVERQEPSGSWSDSSAGSAYGTAMALIILQMPKRYLPIFQK
ncbi:MAG: prenyltransferase/squalene oxidase repeat-containing protein [Phycisphaerales bacterium JB050]